MPFLATSTGATTMVHNWDFGDGNTNVGQEVNHTYSTAGDFTTTLHTVYSAVTEDNCAYLDATRIITAASAPTGTGLDLIRNQIDSISGSFEKCPSGFIRLQVEGAPYDSTFWRLQSLNYDSINESPYNEATYRIDGVDANQGEMVYATLKDQIGCVFDTNPITVTDFTGSGVFISSSESITEDPDLGKVINMADGTTSISLSVSNGVDPAWSPGAIFDDSTLVSVIAYPNQASQQVYVTATDPNACVEMDSVTVVSPPLRGDKNFSPNGDGINDCWEVANTQGYSCQITIFDGKGRRIKSITTSPADDNSDQCFWDGTRDGNQQLPVGVYYYTLNCTGDISVNQGGSILLAR